MKKTTTDNFKFPARLRTLTEAEQEEAFKEGWLDADSCIFDMYHSGVDLTEVEHLIGDWEGPLLSGLTRRELLRITRCAPKSPAEKQWLKSYNTGANTRVSVWLSQQPQVDAESTRAKGPQ